MKTEIKILNNLEQSLYLNLPSQNYFYTPPIDEPKVVTNILKPNFAFVDFNTIDQPKLS